MLSNKRTQMESIFFHGLKPLQTRAVCNIFILWLVQCDYTQWVFPKSFLLGTLSSAILAKPADLHTLRGSGNQRVGFLPLFGWDPALWPSLGQEVAVGSHWGHLLGNLTYTLSTKQVLKGAILSSQNQGWGEGMGTIISWSPSIHWKLNEVLYTLS